jgi:hypothetical protein
MANKLTTFEVTGNFGRAQTNTMEKIVRESLVAAAGITASVFVTQMDDRTLAVSICETKTED